MGKSYSAPTPPDPKETAAAQTGTNVATALANATLKNVNQVTPNGNLNYEITGYTPFHDPTSGADYNIPQYTATQTLSPAGQEIKTNTDAAQKNLSSIASNQSAFLKDYLPQGVDLQTNYDTGSPDKVEAALMARLNPQLEQSRNALETKLTNQGLVPGSKAYNDAIDAAGRQENDARLGAILNATQQQAALAGINRDAATFHNQSALTERNQPINEITALLSGSQVQQPNFVNTSQPTIPTVDYAGLVNQNYAQQVANSQAQFQSQQSMMGGLFGLGSAFLMSDRRVKTDIRKVGTLDNGLPVYLYRYKFGGPMHIGVMAQDVEQVKPEAVVDIGGIKHVDYAQAVEAV